MPWLPDDGCEIVADQVCALAGEDSADDEDCGIGTTGTGGDAFFNAGDAEPAGAGAGGGGRAEGEAVAVGVGLDDGQQLGVRSGDAGEEAEVIFESLGIDFDPAGAGLHLAVQEVCSLGQFKDQFRASRALARAC